MGQSWAGQLAETAAMMRAAMKSDPSDLRYPRLLARLSSN